MIDSTDYDDYIWLTSQEAGEWLEKLANSKQPLHRQVSALRKHFTATRTHCLLEQIDLRNRAKRKFSNATKLFFTKTSLEQATDQVIADYKAKRFPADVCVADFCCGIGGDLLALAKRGSVIGIDKNRVVAYFARTNLEVARDYAKPNYDSSVLLQEVDAIAFENCEAWHCDPDRRPTGKRTTNVAFHSPSYDTLCEMITKCNNAALKLAPGSKIPQAWKEEAEWEWISRDKECKQLMGWFGTLAKVPGTRTATRVFSDERIAHSYSARPIQERTQTSTLQEFLYVPDPALFASRLDTSLAAELQLQYLGEGPERPAGYLTGDSVVHNPLLDCFQVLEVLPFDEKRLAGLLHEKSIGRLEIKQRRTNPAFALNLDKLRKQLKISGDNETTLLITNLDKHTLAILARRV